MAAAPEAATVGATLVRRWLELAGSRGDRPAFRRKSRGVWRTLTWSEWQAAVAQLVHAWSQRGLVRGSTVLVMVGNRFEWPIVDVAAQALGLIVVGVHPSATAEGCRASVVSSGATIAVVDSTADLARLRGAGLPSSVTAFVLDAAGPGPLAAGVTALDLGPQGRAAEAGAEAALARCVAEVRSGDIAARLEGDGASAGLRSYTHADLLRAATEPAADDGRWTLTVVSSSCIAERIRQWRTLLADGTVHFPEGPETITNDVREVMPDVVCAPTAFWEAQRSQTLATLAEAPRTARSIFRFASSTPDPGWLRRLLMRNVRHHLGIVRGTVVFDGRSAATPELLDWYRSIGAAVAPQPSRTPRP